MPLGGIIAGGLGLVGSLIGGSSSSSAARTAAGYQPTHSGEADDLAWQLIQQQAANQPDWSNYDTASQMQMAQYYNMMGQPYTSTVGGGQTINPEYTDWLANNPQGGASSIFQPGSGYGAAGGLGMGGAVGGLGLLPLLFSSGGGLQGWLSSLINRGTGGGQGEAPDQYITTPGETTTYDAPETSYSDYLNQYLSGAFDPQSDDIYSTYHGRAVQGARSGLTARGLNTSPYGAGIEGEVSGEFARQWALDEENRRSSALQNYMAGQSGMQGLGQSALSSALALEQLQQGWSQPAISNSLQYMGMGQGNPALAASMINQAGQGTQQAWANMGTGIGNLFQGGSSIGNISAENESILGAIEGFYNP